MGLPYEDAMKELMAEFESTRSNLAKAQESMQAASGTARSKSRMLSVTVDGHGEVTELKFHNQSWRTMAPGELSKVILQTIKDARQAAQKEMLASVSKLMPAGLDLTDAFAGKVDWASALPSAPEVPGIIQDYLATALPDPAGKDTEDTEATKPRRP
jgi:DNA-binding protein YbaB